MKTTPKNATSSTPVQGKKLVDPREIMVLGVLGSLGVWHSSALGLAVFLLFFLFLRFYFSLEGYLSPTLFKRMALFCLFWGTLAFLLSFTPVVFNSGAGPGTIHQSTVVEAALAAAIIFMRLLVLLIGAAILNSLCSAYSLGLALVWFLRPVLKKNAWRPALALALMVNFFHMILQTSRDTAKGLRSRCIATSRIQYWWLFLPQFFRLSMAKAQGKGTAVVLRGLDSIDAWNQLDPLPGKSILRVLILSALGLLIVRIY